MDWTWLLETAEQVPAADATVLMVNDVAKHMRRVAQQPHSVRALADSLEANAAAIAFAVTGEEPTPDQPPIPTEPLGDPTSPANGDEGNTAPSEVDGDGGTTAPTVDERAVA